MKKILFHLFFYSALLLCSTSAIAGDYLTNTNQSIRFLRNPSRYASIGVDGIYFNPAGVAFLNSGWHLQLNLQNPVQERNTLVNYGPLFGANYSNPGIQESDGSFTKKYRGKVNGVIQPSLFVAYNYNDWAFQFGFGIIGGGGKCKFDDGVGTFEALVGQMGMQSLGAAFAGYSLNSKISGKSYYYSFTLGAARKITDKLSVSVGLRPIIASNKYEGFVNSIKYRTIVGGEIDAPTDFTLDCSQKGFGIAPIIGVDYQPNKYINIAAKYEFQTSIKLKSSAKNNESFSGVASSSASFSAFLDGAKSHADLPAMSSLAVQVSPIDELRLSVGYNHFFDVQTKQWNKDLLKDTDEIVCGVEYDLSKYVEISAGFQHSFYNQNAANYSDLSFNLDCSSVGFGVGVNVTDDITVNLAYFKSFYKSHKEMSATGFTRYSRTNRVLGLGLEWNF